MQGVLLALALCFLISARSSHGASPGAVRSRVEPGDFLVFTVSYATGFASGSTHGLAAVSPSGKIRFALQLDEFSAVRKSFIRQTAISPDGKYAFTTASFLADKLTKPTIFVTRIKGDDPKVVQTITLSTKDSCILTDRDDNAPIAVGSASVEGEYDLYVARQCIGPSGSSEDIRSIDVLKIRYNPSTGKFTPFAKKPYYRGGLNTRYKDGFTSSYSGFQTMRVIAGRPYGLLGQQRSYKLLRLEGSQKSLLSAFIIRNPGGGRSGSSWTIASPDQFLGSSRPSLASVKKSSGTLGAVTWGPFEGQTISESTPEDPNGPQLAWEGSVATDLKTKDEYAFLRDEKLDKNLTLYKMNRFKFSDPPTAVFKLPPYLLPNPPKTQGRVNVVELHVVP